MKVGNITFDCTDVLRVARFWSAVLERPLDERSGEHFASIGGTDPDRIEPAWYFARVPEGKQAKNRMHLDLTTPDPEPVQRLVALGARVAEPSHNAQVRFAGQRSLEWFRGREAPRTAEDFGPRLVKPDGVVPAVHEM